MQQLDRFPSEDYVMLEPMLQNDSFVNCRVFNKFVGTFAVLKYVSLSKTDPQTPIFFSYLESLNQTTGYLFVKNLNIFYDDAPNQDENLLTLVLIMENNVATLRQVMDERKAQNQPYSEEELMDIIYQWTWGFLDIKNPDLRARARFDADGFFLVPSVNPPNMEQDYVDLNTKYVFKMSNFDSFLGPSMDPAEENLVLAMSSFVFQILETDPDHISPEIFSRYPKICNLLLEMQGGHLGLETLLNKIMQYERKSPDEGAFWPVNPILPDLSEIERVKSYDTLVDVYNTLGFYSSAFKPAFLNYQYHRQQNSKSAEYAKVLNDLGVLFWRLGKYDEAKSMLIEARDLIKELYGENHISMAICFNNLGLVYEDLNDGNEALRYLELSYELKLGLGNVDKLAVVMNNLANLNDKTGLDEEKARTYFENALEIKEDMMEIKDHPSIAITLNNLAVFYANKGDFEKATGFMEKEKKISENLSNESYIISLNNLAYINAQKGALYDAQNFYISASLILAKQFKMRTPLAATIFANYASLLYQMADYKNAASMLERCLEIKLEVLGPNHQSYAASAHNLGEIYLQLERYDDAIKHLIRSLEIKETFMGSYDKKLLVTINNIGFAFLKVKDYEKAGSFFYRALNIDDSDVTSLNNNALCSCLTENHNAAIEQYLKAWEILVKNKGEENEEAMKIANNLAAAFVKVKDFEKAEEFLRTSLRIAQSVFPEKVEFAVKTKERLEHLGRVRERKEKSFM